MHSDVVATEESGASDNIPSSSAAAIRRPIGFDVRRRFQSGSVECRHPPGGRPFRVRSFLESEPHSGRPRPHSFPLLDLTN